jgi:hypothetical protein
MEPALMVRRVEFPSEALDDVTKLLRLSNDQLEALDRLFSTGESAFPLRNSFVEKVENALCISSDVARSVVAVCHLLLRDIDAIEDKSYADEMLLDFRDFIETQVPENEGREALLGTFDDNLSVLKSLSTPKPEPIRLQKLRKLASGPESRLAAVRTICQLRPFFYGEKDNEEIEWLLPVILMEIELEEPNGTSRTAAFKIDNEMFEELQDVVNRTRMKIDVITQRFGSDIISEE